MAVKKYNSVDWTLPLGPPILFKNIKLVFDYEAGTLTITPIDMDACMVFPLNTTRTDVYCSPKSEE
jgi:hypothetical protein